MIKLNLSVILFVKITCHYTSWFFFIISSFPIITPSVYADGIFSYVFTDGYCEGIFSRRNLLQFTYENILLVCLFVFVNFFL